MPEENKVLSRRVLEELFNAGKGGATHPLAQASGKVLDANVVDWVRIACYESLASNLLASNAVALDANRRCGASLLGQLR
jgi:hypothetical protein